MNKTNEHWIQAVKNGVWCPDCGAPMFYIDKQYQCITCTWRDDEIATLEGKVKSLTERVHELERELGDLESRNDAYSECFERGRRLWQEKNQDENWWPSANICVTELLMYVDHLEFTLSRIESILRERNE